MNIISHSHAYSLYPRALQDKVSLICCSNEHQDRDKARQKYVDRRYYMIQGDGTAWKGHTGPPQTTHSLQFNHASVLDYFHISKDRHLNDRSVWKIRLDPITAPENPQLELPWVSACGYPIMPPLLLYERLMKCPIIESNSWRLAPIDRSSTLSWYKAVYSVYQQPTLQHSYCLSQTVMAKFADIIEAILFAGILEGEMEIFLHNKGRQCDDFLQHKYVSPKSLCYFSRIF